jgi:hypothetical protein
VKTVILTLILLLMLPGVAMADEPAHSPARAEEKTRPGQEQDRAAQHAAWDALPVKVKRQAILEVYQEEMARLTRAYDDSEQKLRQLYRDYLERCRTRMPTAQSLRDCVGQIEAEYQVHMSQFWEKRRQTFENLDRARDEELLELGN